MWHFNISKMSELKKNSIQPHRIAMIMGKMVGGGLESVILSIYHDIDKKKFQFDFIIDSDSTLIPYKEIESLGGRIIEVPPYQKMGQHLSALIHIFKKEKYQIVHSNMSTLSLFSLFAAKVSGVPIRISHNHNLLSPKDGLLKNASKSILKLFANIFPTDYIAPTYETGRWLFGSKVANQKLNILKNPVNVDKFKFDSELRLQIRHNLGLSRDTVLVGNFARFVGYKNHIFLIEVARKLFSYNDNARLLLIGNGPEKIKIQKYVNKFHMENKIYFLENKSNISDYYSALDLFVLPSTKEAFGMVLIEAQISGLPVLVSQGVTDEAMLSSELWTKMSGWNTESWAKKILEVVSVENSRVTRKKEAMQMNFDGKNAALFLESLYSERLNKINEHIQ